MTKPIMVNTRSGRRPAKYQIGQHVAGRMTYPSTNELVSGVIDQYVNNDAAMLDQGRVRIKLDPESRARNGIFVTAWINVEPGVTIMNIDTLNTPETVTRTLPVADKTIRPLPALVGDRIVSDEQQSPPNIDIDKLIEEVKKYPNPNPQLITFYEMGRRGIIPFQWKRFAKLLDPEYTEYLRLQKKFS